MKSVELALFLPKHIPLCICAVLFCNRIGLRSRHVVTLTYIVCKLTYIITYIMLVNINDMLVNIYYMLVNINDMLVDIYYMLVNIYYMLVYHHSYIKAICCSVYFV